MKECNQYDNWCEKEKRTCNNCYYERCYNMTDEENKAFQYYKECNEKDLENYEYLHEVSQKQTKYLEILLNLIEKQSKEIEELKTEKAKRSWVHIKENGEVVPLFYVSEDKIKAKIE